MHAFLTQTPPDIKIISDVLEIRPDKSIGIDEVREILHFLSRKPLVADHNTVIIYEADKLTLPAQNALLKVLEEPPGASLIYLVTHQPDLLLPTIQSRVTLVESETKTTESPRDLEPTADLIKHLCTATNPGTALSLIDKAGFSRESALLFLVNLEHLLHTQAASPKSQTIPHPEKIYTLLHRTRSQLNSNINVRLAMDHFALGLSSEPIDPDS